MSEIPSSFNSRGHRRKSNSLSKNCHDSVNLISETDETVDKVSKINFKVGENDASVSHTPRQRSAKVVRNRRTRSLYGVSPNCKFGPKGGIQDNSATTFPVNADYYLLVNTSDLIGELHHFWESTGFCPPLPHQDAYKYDLSKDMEMNLAYIGSIPNSGIKQVRIHWLLDLITVKRMNANHQLVYDFTKLDKMVFLLLKNGLKPGFELMGSPSNFFNDFENKTQLYLFKGLVHELAQRYINIYGYDYVRSWNFETWNEPDCHDFDNIKMTVQGFLNYYDACFEGLKTVDLSLKFGGPADGCNKKHTKYASSLIEHVINGTNFFTGLKDLNIDFISFHRKGNGSSKFIFEEELKVVNSIKSKYGQFALQVPFYNDEADPLVGWSKDRWWHAEATYAAMVTKVIIQHQNVIFTTNPPIFNYILLSNDNGFLSYFPHQFTQRTLNARFQMNNTCPSHVQFIRKPVQSAMMLLSMLGEYTVHHLLVKSDKSVVSNFSNIGALSSVHFAQSQNPSSDCWQLSIMLYFSDDTMNKSESTVNLHTFILSNHMHVYKISLVMVALYTVDNINTNPYDDWIKGGKPNYPPNDLFDKMRKKEGPMRFQLFQTKAGKFVLNSLKLYPPSVTLIHICAKPLLPPEEVSRVMIYNITAGQILITWSDKLIKTKCIKTYQVEYSTNSETGYYRRLNEYDVLYTAFVVVGQNEKSITGYYRINAIDYWGNNGSRYELNLNIILKDKDHRSWQTIPDPGNQKLIWNKPPLTVLVIKKMFDESALSAFKQLVCWLIEVKHMVVYVEYHVIEDGILATDPQFTDVKSRLQTFAEGKDDLTGKIDFIICLGGDGTLLYASSLFQTSVPPVMAFNLGSLGFLTPFIFANYKETVSQVMLDSECENVSTFKNIDKKCSKTMVLICVSPEARHSAWVSLDGRNRQEIFQGDSVLVTMAQYPVPSICAKDQIDDWFDSLAECLHWNVRKPQKPISSSVSTTSMASIDSMDQFDVSS
ncbi:hypothetical protein KUTeg_001875 [Tegillarca granosa]|uniref:NAD(+) kinase n=1 Tax=Tegillarca granosa TaxID=220873 RepID=A0ABQ9FSR0_TEGGR|nr:hypothetical protein KUTeg_001875 [Tegillarca granosa]